MTRKIAARVSDDHEIVEVRFVSSAMASARRPWQSTELHTPMPSLDGVLALLDGVRLVPSEASTGTGRRAPAGARTKIAMAMTDPALL